MQGVQDGRLAARRRVAIREVWILTATLTKWVRVRTEGLCKVPFRTLMVSLSNHPSIAMSILRQALDERAAVTRRLCTSPVH